MVHVNALLGMVVFCACLKNLDLSIIIFQRTILRVVRLSEVACEQPERFGE